jgi:DNA polymerase-1
MSENKRLFLLDGSALAYRAFFAFIRNPLINSRGENVSAVFGFANTLLNLLDQEEPTFFSVIFDTPEPTFRHKMYKEYKAQRADMPQDMVEQLPRIRQLCEVLNIPLIEKPGYEADDIMGTLASQASSRGIETVLVSGDKDMMQLVSSRVTMLNPKRSGEQAEWLDSDAVTEKMGVPPTKIIDYLALVGDSSDNIPGVSGIGPKRARTLLQEYESVEDIYDHLNGVTNKRLQTSLHDNEENARLSKTLARIQCDVPLDIRIEDLTLGEPDTDEAVAFFQKLEFRSLVDRFSKKTKNHNTDYRLIQSRDELDTVVQSLNRVGVFSFDTETTDVRPLQAELVGLSFSWESDQAVYIPVKAPRDETDNILSWTTVRDALKPVLENPDLLKCAHNAKYDLLVLQRHGIEVRGLEFDTMVASYLINPSNRQHNLDSVSLTWLNVKKVPISDLIGSGRKQIGMDEVPLKKIAHYAGEDADVTLRLKSLLGEKLAELELRELFETVEMPLVSVLARMEQNGVALDKGHLSEMSRTIDAEMERLEAEIYELAGESFNINSPKQLSVILFETLKLPVIRRTKTGYSTDVAVLEELSRQHELPKRILEYRQLSKLKSTYIDALPRLVNPASHRLHTSYNQTVAATGRLSSSEPNLQNIPIRTELGRQIRGAFVTGDPDHVILDADYSQIELRVMAHLSDDETLKTSFMRDEDIHTRTAALVFQIDADDVTPDQRRKAKEVNFGIMYGMGAFGLSQRLDISPEEADAFIKAYFANYPGVYEYMNTTLEQAREREYVTTLLGRRRYVPEINSDNRRVREFAERTAINMPIQGTAADLIKLAMIRIQNRLDEEGLASLMIMQVHDELVFEVPGFELETLKTIVRSEMEGAMSLSIPIKVEIGSAGNWLDAH